MARAILAAVSMAPFAFHIWLSYGLTGRPVGGSLPSGGPTPGSATRREEGQ